MYDKYNPNDMSEGFSRGYYLVRVSTLFLSFDKAHPLHQVARHIWTGPASASARSQAGTSSGKSNAKTHNITRVTPHMIAYVAVQVRLIHFSDAALSIFLGPVSVLYQ